MNSRQKRDTVTLEILQAIENNNDVTQRHLAGRLNVALGLANSYLKRCVHKGLIKVTQAPANRYLYYLTPKGFAEKSRLTADYLSFSFDFYRRASTSCKNEFLRCEKNGWEKILLCGISELAEIASLRAKEQNIKIVGIFDLRETVKEFLGLPVYTSMNHLPDFDVCVITNLENPSGLLEYLNSYVAREKILVPDVLGLNTVIKTE